MMARMSAFQNKNSAKPFKTFQESVSPSPKALSSGFPLGPAFLLFSPFPPSKHVLRFIRQKWTIPHVQLKLLPSPGCYTNFFCSAALDYWRPQNKAPFCQIPLLGRFRANCDPFPPHPNLESSSSSLYFQRSSHMASLFESGLIAQKLRDLGIKIVPQGLNRF